MSKVRIELPPKLIPVFTGEAMYRGAYGGRGSAKTRSFAKMAAAWGIKYAQAEMGGVIVCGREFMNSLDDSSFAEIKGAILSEPWLLERYDLGDKYIRTKDRRIEFKFVGLRYNLNSIKSKSKIRLFWVDEAEAVTELPWSKAIPTVREDGSEIWVTWNPEREASATHKRFRLDPPDDSKIVEMNFRDNPWFPDTLNKIRIEDFNKRPDQYGHVWNGEFVTVVEGSYFAKELAAAKDGDRIGAVGPDPLMTYKVFCDLGGTGARSDAFSMWVVQFVGLQIRVLDHYIAQGQPLATHLIWLRDRGYKPDNTGIWLPHDGETNDRIIDVNFRSAFEDAQYEVEVIPNQGKGAAKARIEAVRRMFPVIWFNEATTKNGRKALGWYHEKLDEKREIGLGPDHDWSSHDADSFGLMCIVYEPPVESEPFDLDLVSEWS